MTAATIADVKTSVGLRSRLQELKDAGTSHPASAAALLLHDAAEDEIRSWAFDWIVTCAWGAWRSVNRAVEQAPVAPLAPTDPGSESYKQRIHRELGEEAETLGVSRAEVLRRRATEREERSRKLHADLAQWETTWAPVFRLAHGLLNAEFFTGSRIVTWGAATATDHQDRIAFIDKKITAHEVDLDLHERALVLLGQHNWTCLNDGTTS